MQSSPELEYDMDLLGEAFALRENTARVRNSTASTSSPLNLSGLSGQADPQRDVPSEPEVNASTTARRSSVAISRSPASPPYSFEHNERTPSVHEQCHEIIEKAVEPPDGNREDLSDISVQVVQKRPFKFARRKKLLLLAVALVLAVIAVALGGILGSRAARRTSTKSVST